MEKLWVINFETELKYVINSVYEGTNKRKYFYKTIAEYRVRDYIESKQLKIETETDQDSNYIFNINRKRLTKYIIPSEVRISFRRFERSVYKDATDCLFYTWTMDFKVSEDEKLLEPYRIIRYLEYTKFDKFNGRYVYDDVALEIRRYKENDYYIYSKVYGDRKFNVYEYRDETAKKYIEDDLLDSCIHKYKVTEYNEETVLV